MALASAKQLLDELMGRDRDLAPTEKHIVTWGDPDVCKHFLVKFCFHDLFVNTRADMGPCPKIHDERLKEEYERSSRYRKMGYELDFMRYCEQMLEDVERRIQRAKSRLELNARKQLEAQNHNVGDPQAHKEQVQVLTERINSLLAQVEMLGCEGKVEEAQGIMKLCDKLREERQRFNRLDDSSRWKQAAESQEKQMEVCEVCGAFLIVGDAPQRVDDHLTGKQHMGYAKVKQALNEVSEIMNKTYYGTREPRRAWEENTSENRASYHTDRLAAIHPEPRVEREREREHRPRDRDSSKHNDHDRHHNSRRRSRSPRNHTSNRHHSSHRSSHDHRRR